MKCAELKNSCSKSIIILIYGDRIRESILTQKRSRALVRQPLSKRKDIEKNFILL